ncbi:hypothetical protein K0M31_008371 [Melipona bicolor]|uniref:Uncharacterized protein n=1 Tax=Melipona bicolor TaxID=60889 RepID=A0AA40FQU9_9HYME|nr:hypothetical protein K0M31_008371 [Melipona bicolor]
MFEQRGLVGLVWVVGLMRVTGFLVLMSALSRGADSITGQGLLRQTAPSPPILDISRGNRRYSQQHYHRERGVGTRGHFSTASGPGDARVEEKAARSSDGPASTPTKSGRDEGEGRVEIRDETGGNWPDRTVREIGSGRAEAATQGWRDAASSNVPAKM